MQKKILSASVIACFLFVAFLQANAQYGGIAVDTGDAGVVADETGVAVGAGDTGVVADEDGVAVSAGGTSVVADENGVYVNAGGVVVDTGAGVISVKNAHSKMYMNLKGKILLKVEDEGKAYYVNSRTSSLHYLGRPKDAFEVMRGQGIGITNKDLEKIEIGMVGTFGEDDDGDGLSNLLEDAIGTDKNKKDTDGDGFDDKAEIDGEFNPLGSGKLTFDVNFSVNQTGKIFLQIENNGEAWYISPDNQKRYFLGRPGDAFGIMRALGLGITNENFNNI